MWALESLVVPHAVPFVVFYRDKNGRQRRLTLGRYPAVKLVDARELACAAQNRASYSGDQWPISVPRARG
jgi:Arm domain-containing DNA-binding protein